MKLSQFNYALQPEQLAKYPAEYRDESRLLVLHRKTGEIEHKIFKDIINYSNEGDVFVFNDTKVFPARLRGNKELKDITVDEFIARVKDEIKNRTLN